MPSQTTRSDTPLRRIIELCRAGDAAAKDALIRHACDRLLLLTRKMFHDFPRLQRWEQTGDVFQLAMLRLSNALKEVEVESPQHFFNLAALQIRRTLLDLTKHHFGSEGAASKHQTPRDGENLLERVGEPTDLEKWNRFHSIIEHLPKEQIEVVNLLFYEDLTQDEAAEVLGISVRTLKRRWQTAKLKLYEVLSSERLR